jgi:hypothetical protein
MRYILDFDHTLLDTDVFVQRVVLDGREHVLITPDIWRYYNVRDFLYDDVIMWLNSKSKESLHILTAMTPSLGELSCEFQREKLASGNFTELVSSITFMVGEKGVAAGGGGGPTNPPPPPRELRSNSRRTNHSFLSMIASINVFLCNQRFHTATLF